MDSHCWSSEGGDCSTLGITPMFMRRMGRDMMGTSYKMLGDQEGEMVQVCAFIALWKSSLVHSWKSVRELIRDERVSAAFFRQTNARNSDVQEVEGL